MIESATLDEILFYKNDPGRVIMVHSSSSVTLEMLEGPLKGTQTTIKFKNLKKEENHAS